MGWIADKVRSFLDANRRSGSTTEIAGFVEALASRPIWIVVPNRNLKAHLENDLGIAPDKVITVDEILDGRLNGQKPRVVLFDPSAVWEILQRNDP